MVKPRSTPLHRLLAGGALLSAVLHAGVASADPPASPSAAAAPKQAPEKVIAADPPVAPPPADPVAEKAPDSHRSGLAINLSFGNGFASVVGYPNDPQKVGYARYYYESGVRPGGMNSLWVGGAITDWFVFGVGFNGGALQFTGKTTVATGGLIFHAETFPLYFKGGGWRDVGIMLDAGLGNASITDDGTKVSQVDVSTPTMMRPTVPYFFQPKAKLVDGGAASLIGAGIFYEAAKVWRVRIAPMMYANYIWSDTVRRPGFFLGVHATFYSKPSKD
jgi:hypothetical protein